MRFLAAVLVALTLAAPSFASEAHPTQDELEAELVCPTCHEPLDESSAPAAVRIKDYIRKRIAQGATEDQIKNELVAQFGSRVLGVPGTHGFDLLAWVLPLGGGGLGLVVVGFGAWTWSRNRDDEPEGIDPLGPPSGLAPDVEQRVDDELARFDV